MDEPGFLTPGGRIHVAGATDFSRINKRVGVFEGDESNPLSAPWACKVEHSENFSDADAAPW